MARYIDAVLLKEKLLEAEKSPYFTEYARLVKIINRIQTADVEEVRHGEWVFTDYYDGRYRKIYACTCCQAETIKCTNFCPECGARMDGKEKNDGKL